MNAAPPRCWSTRTEPTPSGRTCPQITAFLRPFARSMKKGLGNEASDGFGAPSLPIRPVWKPLSSLSSRHRYCENSLTRLVAQTT